MVLSALEKEVIEMMRTATTEGQKRIAFWAEAVIETEAWADSTHGGVGQNLRLLAKRGHLSRLDVNGGWGG
jgi:hypothetical protein